MSKRKILIADYNTRELQRLKVLLQGHGFEVLAVQDGEAALDAFRRTPTDIVLLSAMLSKKNGFDVCQEIKESPAGRDVPVVIATSVYKGEKYRVKALHERKASDFLEKPVPDDVLLASLDRCLLVSLSSASSHPLPAPPPRVPTAPPPVAKPAPTPEPAAKPAPPPQPPPVAKTPESPVRIPEPPKSAPADDDRTVVAPPELDIERFLSQQPDGPAADEPPRGRTDKLDRMFNETLAGLGITMADQPRAATPAPAPRPEPAPKPAPAPKPEPAPKPARPEPPPETAGRESAEEMARRVKGMIDTDLAQRLNETLSGLGIHDPMLSRARPAAEPADTVERTLVVPQPEADTEEEGTRFGDYHLIERIGVGGMAELYKARKGGEQGFQKIVAIKKILPHLSDNQELVAMFIDEAKIAAQLSHQNIANIFDFGKADDSYYIAMEFVEGFDLRNILGSAKQKSHNVPHKLAAYIVLQIASALEYAHNKRDQKNRDLNIVHRDVSPQNLLISREGEVKLVDFGISKAESKIHHTVKGALKGKLLYMSPEQAWGKSVDKRSDLYSLGIVLCEMASGKVLFEDSSEFDVLEKVRSGRIPVLETARPSLPQRLRTIIDRALEIEPDTRYQDAGQMARDLHDYLSDGGSMPTPKDLRAFLTRLYPAEFGFTETDVAQLTFDEFMERPPVTPVRSGEDTMLLAADELADLEDLPLTPLSEPVLSELAKLEDEDEEIVVQAGADPPKPTRAPTPPPSAPSPPAAPPPPAKARPEPKPAPPPKGKGKAAPPPKPAPPPKSVSPAEPAAKTQLTGRLKPSPATATVAAPSFGASAKRTPAKKSPLPLVLAALALLAVAGGGYYFLFLTGEPGPAPAPPAPEPPAVALDDPPNLPDEPLDTGEPAAAPTQPVTATPTPAATPAPTPAPTRPVEPPPTTAAAPAQPEPARPAPAQPEPARPEPTRPEPTPPPAAPPPQPTAQPTPEPTPTPAPRSAETPQPAPARTPEPQPTPAEPKPTPAQPAPTPRPAGGGLQMSLPETAKRVQEGDIVNIQETRPQPEAIRQVNPVFPEVARRARIRSATLLCRILISHTGDVERVVIVSANPENAKDMLARSAEQALLRWKYKPAEKDGVKVRVWQTVQLTFR